MCQANVPPLSYILHLGLFLILHKHHRRPFFQTGTADKLKSQRAGSLAQSTKCLLCKHKDMCLVPRIHIKMPSTVVCAVCACNIRAGETEAGEFLGLAGQPVQPNS